MSRRWSAGWRAGVWLAAVVVVLQACGPAEPEEAVVATVGGAPITAEAFVRSYEAGFGSLKQGDDPKRAYLQHMIAEALLAREGVRRGLDASPRVRRQVDGLHEKLLVEEVFEREVNDRVEVTDEDIRQALQQEQVRFKLRYLPAPTRQRAAELRRRAQEQGFDATVEHLIARERSAGWTASDFVSPYLARHEVEPAFFAAVENLEVGQFSEPVAYRGSYVILQLADVRREPLGPVTDPALRSRYEQILFQRKARERAHRYVQETMRPVGMELRGETYRTLREALWAWHQDAPPEGNLLRALGEASGASARTIRDLLPEVLITTRDREWTVRAFLEQYPVDRYPLRAETREAFEGDLYDAAGLLVRDHYFAEKARREEWDEAPRVQEKLALWTDKWVYRAMIEQIADTVTVSDDELRAYFEEHRAHYRPAEDAAVELADVQPEVLADARRAKAWAALPGVVARLRERYPAEIHEEVLDTLQVQASGQGPDVMIVEGHSGRPAYPVVDPQWR